MKDCDTYLVSSVFRGAFEICNFEYIDLIL